MNYIVITVVWDGIQLKLPLLQLYFMGKFYTTIGDHHKEFIESQHLFFVSTAPLDGNGHINLSPKGLDSFRILSTSKVAYMDIVVVVMKPRPIFLKMGVSHLCFVPLVDLLIFYDFMARGILSYRVMTNGLNYRLVLYYCLPQGRSL